MKKIIISLLCLALCTSTSFAWNRAGHMVTGAIAYSDLKANHPETLRKALALLHHHPEFHSRWAEAIKDLPDKENHELYIFMMVARWADDIRDNPTYSRPNWHYINFPFTFDGTPTRQPDSTNIITAFTQSFANASSPSLPDAERAISLAWIFHLVGDVHQPLHTSGLFSTEFPNGDKGGNDFRITAEPGGRLINLHSFWDGVLIGSDNFQQVKNQAIRTGYHLSYQRAKLQELKETNFGNWAKDESFRLAKEFAYENGALKSGSTLTQEYRDKAKAAGERRIALAAYRLADLLVKLFEPPVAQQDTVPVTPSRVVPLDSLAIYGNKNSKIYHLPNCPSYKDISPQNRIPFKSEEEAQKAGYRKAKNCP
jgi:hypothetical protein